MVKSGGRAQAIFYKFRKCTMANFLRVENAHFGEKIMQLCMVKVKKHVFAKVPNP